MNTKTPTGFLAWINVVGLLLAFGAPLAAAADSDAEIKRIVARVNAVESQLDRAVLYEQKTEDPAAGSSLTEQAWFTEAGDWLKTSQDRVSKAGRELTEIWFQERNQPTFLLRREETPAADGGTRVHESRRYHDEDSLIRELTKDAVFKAGAPLETKPIKNVSQPLAKLSEEERRNALPQAEAETLIARLVNAGPPKRDPSAGAGGDSARFRLIQGSTSPNGRFAVAFGFPEAPKSWDVFQWREDEWTGRPSYWIEDWDVRETAQNYLVDLATHRIVGETGGGAYTTHSDAPNGRDNWSHDWSPDGRWLVQVTSDKWSSYGNILAVDPEQGVVGSADFVALAQSRAAAFLAAKKDPTLKRLGRDISVNIYSANVTNDGQLTITLLPTQPGSPESFESPTLIERFQVKRSGRKVSVKFIAAQYQEE